MDTTLSPNAGRNGAKQFSRSLVITAAIALLPLVAHASPIRVMLGTASEFAVLGGSGITVTGPTTITGDIGTYSNPSITGFTNITLNGANHAGDSVTQQAKTDLVTAYNDAAGRTSDTLFTGGFDLVGLTLNSGVYRDTSSLFLSGNLTLDAQGDPESVWIFQAGSTLITASGSTVTLIGGAQACHVFWQVGSSATLGTNTDFVGNILALTSITLNTGADVDGRVLARNGAVTLDTNTITMALCDTSGSGNTGGSGDTGGSGGTGGGGSGGTHVPDNGSTLLLLGSGLGVMLAFGRRIFSGVV